VGLGSSGDLAGQFKNLSKLSKDEEFRKFLAHPKVQALLKNESFRRAIEEKNFFKLMSNQQFTESLKDPDIRDALTGISRALKKS